MLLSHAGAPTDGVDEVQLITPGGTISGGTWQIHIGLDGEVTPDLDWNATAALVQAALEALPSIGENNILVTGGPLNVGDFTLTFVGTLGGLPVPEVDVLDGSLTGTNPTAIASTDAAGVTGTFRGAAAGTYLQDTTNGILYRNVGNEPTPVWAIPPPASERELTESTPTPYVDVFHWPRNSTYNDIFDPLEV